MKTRLLFLFANALLPLFLLAQTPCYSPDIIVQLRPGGSVQNLLRQLEEEWPSADFQLKKELSRRFNLYLLSFDCSRSVGLDLDLLRNEAEVISAMWDSKLEFRRDSLPDDPLFPDQWSLEKIGLPQVWSVAQGGSTPSGKEIVVAVIDNGFELVHPDLSANFWRNKNEVLDGQDNDGNGFTDDVYGWNFHSSSPLIPVSDDHGTNVCGVIGGIGNNGEGVAGVNWKVKILPLHFQGNPSEALQAFEYVLTMRELYNATNGEKGAYIVVTNGSWGLDEPAFCSDYPFWGSLYDLMGAAGVLSVAATANEALDVDAVGDMPTTCPSEYLLTVTNSNVNDRKVSSAAFGILAIDLAAPGDNIPTTDIGEKYKPGFGGTSAACPHVAGTIALLYSLPCLELELLSEADPAAAARLVRDAVLKGVNKNFNLTDITATGGRLNAYNSMKYLHSYCIAKPSERESGGFEELYIGERDFIRVFPNPVSDELVIDFSIVDFQELRFRIYNSLGQEVRYQVVKQAAPFEPQSLVLDVNDWPSGVYFINIFDLGRRISTSFVKL